ncbi:MAG: hypothetical protein JOZ69_08500 [Myxococcales bacterium]|nr:hypothetical protein [Myxococcales bacterium]
MMPTSPRLRHLLPAAALAVCIATAAERASAFGGTAGEMQRQGNFVISNNANFHFEQQINSPTRTIFALRPALDYFIIDQLSIGGAIEFDFQSPVPNDPHDQNITVFHLAPEVGYAVTLTDTISFWPQAALEMKFPSLGNPVVTLVLIAPFLVHPAQHFFVGIGPGFAQDLTSNANSVLTGNFVIGGYFDR